MEKKEREKKGYSMSDMRGNFEHASRHNITSLPTNPCKIPGKCAPKLSKRLAFQIFSHS
jgi:hypothetical protein